MNQVSSENNLVQVGVVAGCVIQKDGKYLLVQESHPSIYGLWNFPAGRVDVGESIEEAAIREAKEETGYEVTLLEKVAIFHESVDRPVKHIFEAEITGGERTMQAGEILDVQWFTFEEVGNLKQEGKLRVEWITDVIAKVQ